MLEKLLFSGRRSRVDRWHLESLLPDDILPSHCNQITDYHHCFLLFIHIIGKHLGQFCSSRGVVGVKLHNGPVTFLRFRKVLQASMTCRHANPELICELIFQDLNRLVETDSLVKHSSESESVSNRVEQIVNIRDVIFEVVDMLKVSETFVVIVQLQAEYAQFDSQIQR